jgi:hypothetical protein
MNESAPLPPTINDFSGTECPLCTLPSLGIEVIVKQHSAITKSACHTPLAEEDRHPNRKAKIVYPTCSPSSTRGRFKQSYSLGSANQEHLLQGRARGCCMKDRLGANGSHCQLLSYHLSLTQMHKRWRKGNLVSRVVLHVKRQRWGSGTGFRRSLSENLLFLAVCLKRYVLWWVKVVRS